MIGAPPDRSVRRDIGTVCSLHRWPLKSAGGEAIESSRLGVRGLAGDRTHALFVENKRGERVPLTAREAPRLLAWSAAYVDGGVVVTDPGGRRHEWGGPALTQALTEDLGRAVTLVRDPRGLPDLPNSVLITTAASHRAVEAALGRTLDLRRWRTNVHLDIDAAPFAEEAWEGRALHVGGATFDLLHPCTRCVIPTRDPESQRKHPDLLRWLTRERGGRFGINARARGEARIAVGDAVHLP